jgi:hypothetical protein
MKDVGAQIYAVSWGGSEYRILLFEKYRSGSARNGNDWDAFPILELPYTIKNYIVRRSTKDVWPRSSVARQP